MGTLVSGVKLFVTPRNWMTFRINVQTFHHKHSYFTSKVQPIMVLDNGTKGFD
jgi:hypothetical protein